MQILAQTGHIVYNWWATPIVGWQLFIAAGLVRIVGFSFTTARMSTLLVGLATAFLMRSTLVRAGVSERNAINFLEFDASNHTLVNPLRIKERVISELEASIVLVFTGQSRSSAEIIEQESRNVRERNEGAIEAMHQTKKQAFRMKEALLRG